MANTWDCYDGTGYCLGSVKAEDLDDAYVVADDTFEVTPAHIEPSEMLDLDIVYDRDDNATDWDY